MHPVTPRSTNGALDALPSAFRIFGKSISPMTSIPFPKIRFQDIAESAHVRAASVQARDVHEAGVIHRMPRRPQVVAIQVAELDFHVEACLQAIDGKARADDEGAPSSTSAKRASVSFVKGDSHARALSKRQ